MSEFIDAVKNAGLDVHSLQIFRNGYLIASGFAEPYGERKLRRIYSTAKSVSGLAVLFAVQEGLIKLDEPIIRYFRECISEEVGENLAALTIKDMMTMSTGMVEDGLRRYMRSGGEKTMEESFFSCEVVHKPGTAFFYNNAVPEMLGILIQKVTGQNYIEYLTPRLLKPMNASISVQTDPQGWLFGMSTTSTAHDLAKFVIFYLQQGMWGGAQLIAPELIRQATSMQVSTANFPGGDKDKCGYGMQMWMNEFGGFRLVGAFGQMGIIVPEKNLAVIYTGMEKRDVDAYVRKYIFEKLLNDVIPETDAALADLREMKAKLSGWSAAPDGLAERCKLEERYDGRRFAIANGRYGLTAITFRFAERAIVVEQGELRVRYEYGTLGRFAENTETIRIESTDEIVYGADHNIVYVSAGWRGETFLFEIRHAANMTSEFFEICFDGDGILLFSENSLERLGIFRSFADAAERGGGENAEENAALIPGSPEYRAERTARGVLSLHQQ